MRLQLLGDSEARDGDLYRYHTVEQSTLRGRNSSAPPPTCGCGALPRLSWPIVSREKDNILTSSAGRRGILYLPYVYLVCDQKRVLYWSN